MLEMLCLWTSLWAFSSSSDRVEIKFVRGNHFHRLLLRSNPSTSEVTCYQDTQLTHQSTIERKDYLSLHEKAAAFVDALGVTGRPENKLCRTPFVVTIVSQTGERTREGCRSSNEGEALGEIIHAAEQLSLK